MIHATDLNRRRFLTQFGGGALGAAAIPRWLDAAPKPKLNFVFFLVDDMGWKDPGCYGSKFDDTPNMDRLAADGMKFTDAYAAAPLCSPTRASILTGMYPARLHITSALPASRKPTAADRWMTPTLEPGLWLKEVTIPEALKPAGYVSACIGKWHLGGNGLLPQDQGFDVNIGGTHIGMVTDHFYPAWKESRNPPPYPVGGVPIEGRPGEYLADRLTDEALKFIEANRQKPFFLYLSHYAVHIPLQAKQDLIAKYERRVNPDDPQQNPIYAAMVESVDQSLGRVRAKLNELGIAQNTVVILMSDNGGVVGKQKPNNLPATSNLPLRAGKATLYEGGIREPMIVYWPGVVKPGSVSKTPVISNDFFPTILEMAGVKLDHSTDGVSLLPLLKQKGQLKRKALYWYFPHYALPGVPGGVIRYEDYKLIEYYDDGRLELYNLADDIGEKNNLAAKMPKKAAELRKMLREWLQSVDAQKLVPNPAYRPAGTPSA